MVAACAILVQAKPECAFVPGEFALFCLSVACRGMWLVATCCMRRVRAEGARRGCLCCAPIGCGECSWGTCRTAATVLSVWNSNVRATFRNPTDPGGVR